MKTNRKKLLEILSKRFGDDPKAIEAVHEHIAKDYDKRLQEVKTAHSAEISEIRKSHDLELSRRDVEAKERHKEYLKQAQEIAESISDRKVKSSSEESATKYQKNLDKLESKLLKRFDTRLDTHSQKIERFSAFAVGAPNRSLYYNGTIISGRYSDVNFIAGAGITLSEVDNEETHQADFTISATVGGVSVQVPTGTVNGVNTNFVFTVAPQIIVLDNANVMNKVSSDGTVNWTGTTTVVLNQAPNFNIFGF